MSQINALLPTDRRSKQGGVLFLLTLLIFFLSSILLYGIYAYARRGDPQSSTPMPLSFLYSTVCLIGISGMVHAATRSVRRDRHVATSLLLSVSGIGALVFMAIQFASMREMLRGPAMTEGTGKGVVGMIAVLAFLHALHVAGGVISLGIVTIRSMQGKYDHERHWPVDFTAHYWHFLDAVWLCMLLTFWLTTGGFG
ncbi:MAG: cytochrome c oxidase subunit 3 [Planctomycetota bacterium]